MRPHCSTIEDDRVLTLSMFVYFNFYMSTLRWCCQITIPRPPYRNKDKSNYFFTRATLC